MSTSHTSHIFDQPLTDSDYDKAIGQLELVARFLRTYRGILEPLGYEAMREKFDRYDPTMPYIHMWTYEDGVTINVNGGNQRETMRLIRKAIGGTWDKDTGYNTFKISRRWSDLDDDTDSDIRITLEGPRDQVCQKIVTGTKTVEHPAVPAREAYTEEVEQVEWVCGNLLTD